MDRIKQLFTKYREIIMYIIIGGCTTIVNWAVYTPMAAAGAALALCNSAAWLAAVIFAFFTNKFLVFESRTTDPFEVIKEAAMFAGSRLISGAFEIVFPSLLVALGLDAEIFGIRGAAAKLITSVAVIVMNYVLSKLIVFRKKKSEETHNDYIGH